MKFVSPLLKHVVYPVLSRTGFLRHHGRNGQLCVVTYHGVRPARYESIDPLLDGALVTAEALRCQIRLLQSRYNVITPEQVRRWVLHDGALPPRAVLLTCDDGLENTVTEMLPILKQEGVECLFFITGSSAMSNLQMLWYEELYLMFLASPDGVVRVEELNLNVGIADRNALRDRWWRAVRDLSKFDEAGRREVFGRVRKACNLPEDWSRRYSEDRATRQRFYLLTLDTLPELVAGGLTVGAHTLSHPVLTQMSDDMAWAEIAQSGKWLGDVLGTPIWALAYPFGDPASASAREFSMAERAGYTCAFVNCDGGFGSEIARFSIPRVHVTADMTLGEFEAHVSGFHNDIRRRFAR